MNALAPSSELIVDSFAGGGGASLGIEMALGRSPDIAINHDAEALAMHAANHPGTRHLPHNVWKVDPVAVTGGRPVGLLWASPDCKHHSKAKGGKPVKREIRDLAWVVVRWAKQVRPRIIILENVEEFRDWGPLDIDGRPCKERKGRTFDAWSGELRRLGYKVEWRELRACDYGAPTIRKRLFLITRRDGRKIVWPAPTHGRPGSPDVLSGKLLPWRAAADIIDWSIPCPSIFLTREEGRAIGVNRPLAPNTMARIAKGVKRYVLDAAEPFIVPVTAGGGGKTALVAAFIAQHNTGNVGREAAAPLSTIVHRGTQQAIVAGFLSNLYGSNDGGGGDMREPSRTVTAGGSHAAEVRAFLVKYYGSDQDPRLDEPLHTVTTRDRFGLVEVRGELYRIDDIGMRMLTPRELFRAQGFPDSYQIETGRTPDGPIALTKTSQVRMCGNSVSPVMAKALAGANYFPDELDRGPPKRARAGLPLLEAAE
jgi:DNA (cytosine-5)-methyltransferase 1